MHLIHIIPGRSALAAVLRHPAPNLILDYEHADLFQLLSEILDIVTYQAVCKFHIGSVVEHIQGTRHIDFKRRCHMTCLRFFLFDQFLIQISQNWHVFRSWIFKIPLIDLMDTPIDDSFFYRFQTILASYDKFTQRQDKICLQRDWIILIRIVHINIHRIDKLIGCGTDFNNLTIQALHKRGIF